LQYILQQILIDGINLMELILSPILISTLGLYKVKLDILKM